MGAADGLKYYDLIEGKGPTAEKGSTVQVIALTFHATYTLLFILELELIAIAVFLKVHFDCIYRSITVVSSREAKLLAGNRSIAQVMWQNTPDTVYGSAAGLAR